MSKQTKRQRLLKELKEDIKTIVITVLVVGIISRFVVRPIQVQGNSMYPTLQDQQIGLANVLSVEFNDIRRFDIVIIYMEEEKEYLVKRVIGLPNETISYVDGVLYVDSLPVEETFINDAYKESFQGQWMEDVEQITLEEDEYYCLGDNRPFSKDSRFYGPFKKEQIIAKGALILFPFSEFGVKSW